MHNDPELDPKKLGVISSDFVKISDTLKEASYAIRKREFSEYPVFAMCKIDQPIGQLLVNTGQSENQWNYFASFMEEFVERGLIADEKTFKLNFKDPDEFCCLFVIDEEFTNFLFIPFPVD